jgi:PIN domain nuclease of toxin-antitoxin system
MKLLLDTHAFLWIVTDQGLSTAAIQAFLEPDNQLYLSAASYWEICIKVAIKKLTVTPDWMERFDEELVANEIQWLPIEKTHCQGVTRLPALHNDPFDRLLIAQAIGEGLTLMTADANIRQYAVPTLW